MPRFASVVIPSAQRCLAFADLILAGIPAKDFARMPKGVKTNHPAFNFGHLALYPDRIFNMIGRTNQEQPDAKFTDLFAAGKECLDDPEGKVYPPMDKIVERFRTRHESVVKAIPEVSEDVWDRPNPNEKMVERFPTVGSIVAFLLSAHMMVHLGQISTWRRCMGLPPAVI